MTYNDINFDLAKVIIYLEFLPENVYQELEQLLSEIKETKTKKDISISKEKLDSYDIEKYPEANSKLIIFGDCSKWTDDYRRIIRIVRKHTACVIIE